MKAAVFNRGFKLISLMQLEFLEVLIRILKFLKLFKFIQRKILDFNPDILITIDSGFSYRIVKDFKFKK